MTGEGREGGGRRAGSRFEVRGERFGPAYLTAIGVHLVGLLALSVWTVVEAVTAEAVEPLQVRLAPPLRDDLPAPPVARLEAALEPTPPAGPAVASDSDADFDETAGRGSGTAREGAVLAAGLGGGGGARGRGGRGGGGGPTAESQGALASGLAWLASHRAGDGGWGPVVEDHGQTLPPLGDPARTGLGLLAFLMAGHAPGVDGPHRAAVDGAVAWLVRRAEDDGLAQGATPRDVQAAPYHLAMGALGMAEASIRAPKDRRLRAALERTVRQILAWQQVGLGFRYDRSESDTSVTSWMVLALRSAEQAGVPVRPTVWTGVRAWLARVSTSDGETGYVQAGDHYSEAMHASGLCLRLLLGESASSYLNQAAADRVLTAAGPPALGSWDAYHLYYAALALYQVGGARWAELNPRLRDGLVALQVQDGCEAGSWAPADPRGWGYDRQLTTAFGTLILETYYRHLVVHEEVPTVLEARVRDALEEQLEVERELLAGALRRGDPAEIGSRLAALDAIREPGEPDDPALAEVRRTLGRWRLERRLDEVVAAADPGPRRALVRELASDRSEAGTAAREELKLVEALADPLADVAVVLSRHALVSSPGPGERRAIALALERGERAYAEKGPRGLSRAESIRAALHARDLPGRLGAPEARDALVSLGRLEAARVAALERAGRPAEARAAEAAWREAHPGPPSAPLAGRPLVALLERLAAGALAPEELPRVEGLAAEWAPSAPPDEVAARLRPAALALLAGGNDAAASRLAELARSRAGRAGEPLELALLLCRKAAPAAALLELDRLGPEERRRPDVRLARQAALRGLGRASEAVDDALGLVRGLGEGTPGWWEALEAAAETLIAAGQARSAALLLEGAHRRHAELGGPGRRDRLVALMHRADALAR